MTKREKAMDLFKFGYNCSQSVLGAFCDDFDIDFKTAMKLSSSFGGGMGRMREVCGAVSGMFMVLGLAYGYYDITNIQEKIELYKIIQDAASRFKDKNNSIICKELLGLKLKKNNFDNPIPDVRNETYYKKRPCINLIGDAAALTETFIKK